LQTGSGAGQGQIGSGFGAGGITTSWHSQTRLITGFSSQPQPQPLPELLPQPFFAALSPSKPKISNGLKQIISFSFLKARGTERVDFRFDSVLLHQFMRKIPASEKGVAL
jgi:hypothetical protein